MKIEKEKLLQRKEVVEEINRHLWLESEKAGYDIGFDKAAEDWLTRFSSAWMQYHLPQQKSSDREKESVSTAKTKVERPRKRSAKSYL